MQERWFVEPGGNTTGPHSLGQLQVMLSSGRLKATDMILKEGTSTPIQASAIAALCPASMGNKEGPDKSAAAVMPEPASAPTGAPAQASAGRSRRRWAIIGGGVAIAVIAAIIAVYYLYFSAPRQNPDLPEWFSPAYRIKSNRGIIFPAGFFKRKGLEEPRPTPGVRGGKYTQEWLEKHFTHYVDWRNAFIWATPKVVYPSDGKILAGVKVIVGEQVNDMSLICTVTPDGQPENMYVQSVLLRERAQGPPTKEDDD
jgi:hypothetical protein